MKIYLPFITLSLLSLFALTSCGPSGHLENEESAQETKNASAALPCLHKDACNLISFKYTALDSLLGNPHTTVGGVTLGPLRNVIRVYLNKTPNVHFIYDDEGNMVLVHIKDQAFLEPLKPDELADAFGEPSMHIPLNKGKNGHHHVYPERGFTYTVNKDQVVDFKVFAPWRSAVFVENYYNNAL